MSKKISIFSFLIVLGLINGCSTLWQQDMGVEELRKGKMLIHTVRRGETLGIIANWYTGKTSNWKTIQLVNPDIQPEKMEVGSKIKIPKSLVIKGDPIPGDYVKRLNEKSAEGSDAPKMGALTKELKDSELEEIINKGENKESVLEQEQEQVQEQEKEKVQEEVKTLLLELEEGELERAANKALAEDEGKSEEDSPESEREKLLNELLEE